MSASQIFLYFCLAFIIGVLINSVIFISHLFWLGFLILGILLAGVFWKQKNLMIIGLCILFLVLGIWRHQVAELEIKNNQLRKYNDQSQEFTLIGKVSTEPEVREKFSKLTIETEFLNGKRISGKVLVIVPKYPQYQYGDKLKIRGNLKTPQIFEDFNYKDYLAKDGIYSIIYFPQIELLKRQDYENLISFSYAKILEFKNKLRESIYQNLSPPQSSILGAMILGDKRRMPQDLKEKLNITGLRHITAISGLHITILTIILMQFLIGLGFWRDQAFYLTLISLTLFVILVGLPPSAVRAGIMASLFLFAQKIGRLNQAPRAIVFAAAGMLMVNPLLLRLDVGFQLSFLAILGIIYLAPIFQDFLKRIPENSFFRLRTIVAMTFSAQIFTLPILVYNFGYLSLIAPLTNVLILPLLPVILGLGFLLGLAGMIWQILGWLFSLPAWFFLTYLTKIVDFFSQTPLASLTVENVHWIWVIVAYLILGFITWWLNHRQKFKFLNY